MTVFRIDPLQDERWQEFVQRHANASVFHATAWMRTLQDAYGYKSFALTTTEPGKPLQNGLPFCRISSWLTGSRIVSLPFADHCDPLADSPESLNVLLKALQEEGSGNRWKYVELRPLHPVESGPGSCSLQTHASFAFHTLDLKQDLESILHSFHKNRIQQKIKKFANVGLAIENGRSEELLDDFYGLLLLTRRRHQLPPQPRSWFQLLAKHYKDELVVWVARHEGKPVASILTISTARKVVYKYGCSDPAFHNLGGMQGLMWDAIRYAKDKGAVLFDFGRSDLDNEGLITYKSQWGTQRTTLQYLRNHVARNTDSAESAGSGFAKRVFSTLPDSCLVAAGRLLYRHMG